MRSLFNVKDDRKKYCDLCQISGKVVGHDADSNS